MKKIINYLNKKESYITQNITLFIILLTMIVLIIDIIPHIVNIYFKSNYNFISTQFTLTTIWWMFAFWYWYKKYERNKELEIIEKLEKEYKTIKELDSWKNLINFWFKEFYYKEQWYITNNWWKYISKKISHNLINLKEDSLVEFIYELQNIKWVKEDKEIIWIRFYIFIIEKIKNRIGLISLRQSDFLKIKSDFLKLKKESLNGKERLKWAIKNFSNKKELLTLLLKEDWILSVCENMINSNNKKQKIGNEVLKKLYFILWELNENNKPKNLKESGLAK